MERYDIVVTGGGPAGLSAATAAAASGSRVLLLERATDVGSPIRTSGGSFIRPLQRLGIPEHLWQPIKVVTFLAEAVSADFVYPDPVGCVLDVQRLYQWLAVKAREAGAEIRCGVGVSGLLRQGSRVVGVTTRAGEEIGASLVIDATGPWAKLGTASRAITNDRHAIGLEVVVDIPEKLRHNATFTLATPATYGWLFPERSGHARLGVGVIRPDSGVRLQEELGRVAAGIAKRYGLPPFDLANPEKHAGVYPIRPPGAVSLLPCRGLILVGDAGPCGSNLLGEGIRYAIISGRLAGLVAGQVANGRRSERYLGQYPRRWRREFGRHLRIAHRLNERISKLTPAQWNRAVELVSGLSPDSVSALISSQMGLSTLLRAARENPRLLVAVGRMVVTPDTGA